MDGATAFWMQWIGQLAACHRHLRRQLAVVASADGLNDTECLLLCCCRFAPPGDLSQQYLAAHIGLSPSQASGVFESLRAKGLLASEPGLKDRRRQSWRITSAGDERIRSIGERLAPFIAALQYCSPSDDQGLLVDLLQRLATVEFHSLDVSSSDARSGRAQEAA